MPPCINRLIPTLDWFNVTMRGAREVVALLTDFCNCWYFSVSA